VQSASEDRANDVAAKLEAGMVFINGAAEDPQAPFGGYKMSGNGREGERLPSVNFSRPKRSSTSIRQDGCPLLQGDAQLIEKLLNFFLSG